MKSIKDQLQQAVTLSTGATVGSRMCAWAPGATEAFIIGSDREMTDAEWTEYCAWLHTPDHSSTVQPL